MCCDLASILVRWGLRDYGISGQLGLESTPEEFVANMVEVFREVKRVLRDDGTVWINLGSSYMGSGGAHKEHHKNPGISKSFDRGGVPHEVFCDTSDKEPVRNVKFKPKDLVPIPWMVAMALQQDGWYLRADIIWAKKNCMPESCTDRPTKAHEYIFLLTKKAKYYYDADAIRETGKGFGRSNWNAQQFKGGDITRSHGGKGAHGRGGGTSSGEGNRNKRTIWTVATQPMPQAHFATYPEKLIKPCVLAGTSEKGCCPECGGPWVRVVEKRVPELRDVKTKYPGGHTINTRKYKHGDPGPNVKTTGWKPTCTCNVAYPDTVLASDDLAYIPHNPVPCTVLDIFCGSATTGVVALENNRQFIGIELNQKYITEIAEPRLRNIKYQQSLFD